MKTAFITKAQIEQRVREDFDAVCGRIIELRRVVAYNSRDYVVDVHCEPPAKFRVQKSDRGDLTHWNDAWCDPYWNLDLVESHPALVGLRSFWTHGHSYEEGTGESQSTSYRIVSEPGVGVLAKFLRFVRADAVKL